MRAQNSRTHFERIYFLNTFSHMLANSPSSGRFWFSNLANVCAIQCLLCVRVIAWSHLIELYLVESITIQYGEQNACILYALRIAFCTIKNGMNSNAKFIDSTWEERLNERTHLRRLDDTRPSIRALHKVCVDFSWMLSPFFRWLHCCEYDSVLVLPASFKAITSFLRWFVTDGGGREDSPFSQLNSRQYGIVNKEQRDIIIKYILLFILVPLRRRVFSISEHIPFCAVCAT